MIFIIYSNVKRGTILLAIAIEVTAIIFSELTHTLKKIVTLSCAIQGFGCS